MKKARFTADQLAQAYICCQILGGRSMRRGIHPGKVSFVEHPAMLMQAAFLETFRPTSPTEVYSEQQPSFIPRSAEEEGWIPIDVLLGCYKSKTRTIFIYYRNIQRFANNLLKCDVADLEFIVRIHENAHALVHLGVLWAEESDVIRGYLRGQETDWKAFLRDRSKAYRLLDSDAHEFLAQILSWMAIGIVEPLSKRNTLQDLFITLMERQPPAYRLSPEMLGKGCYADPTALLSWVRETPRSTRRHPQRQFAEALLRCTFP